MRDSLTVLAILLIGVLTAALVGPYVIDWNSHRALIERRLSEAAGTPVTVGGAIDLKILPTPRLHFGEVAIGDARAGRPRLTADALETELSLAALTRGQIQFVDTTLVRPRLAVAQAADGTVDLALPVGAAADRVAVDHLGVRDGTVVVTLADGFRETLSGLDLDGEATSLRGPFKALGRVAGIPFRLATGAIDGGRLRVKLHLDGDALRPSLDLDGLAAARPLADRPGAVGPAFDGTATLSGRLPLDGTPAAIPWTLKGHVVADRDAAAASDVELRAGADLRALIADGDGTAAFGATAVPSTALHLRGATVDGDGLAVVPDDSSIAPPKGSDLLRGLFHVAGDGAGLVSLPLRLDLSAAFDTATLGGQTLLGTSVRLGLGPDPTAALAFTAEGPQGARLSLDGRVDPGPARSVAGPFGAVSATTPAVFRGRAALQSGDLRRTASWLSPLAPELSAGLAALPARSIAASGDLEVSATAAVARDFRLDVDGSAFAGLVSLTRSVGAERARLFADLASDALVLDRLPDLSGARAAVRDLDVDLALAARAVTIADPGPDLARARIGPIAAGHVALRLSKAGDDLRLDRLALDIDGATVDATASRTGRDARAKVHVSAPHVGPLADALGGLLPTAGTDLLRARAAVLSPLDATLSVAAAAGSDDGPLVPKSFALVGRAGGTRVDAALTPEQGDAASDPAARPVALSLRADAPEAADLLRQFGAADPAAGLGAAHLAGAGRGSLAAGFTVDLGGTIGGTALSFAGHGRPDVAEGRLTLHTADLSPILAALRGAAAAPAKDPRPTTPATIPADATADVGWADGRLEGHGITARVAGVDATGSLSFDLAPRRAAGGAALPQLGGALSLDRLPASAIFALGLGTSPAPAPGVPWSAEPFGAPGPVLPTGSVALTIADMPLWGTLVAHHVSTLLTVRAGAVTLADAAGTLGGGRIGGSVSLRRDAAGATASGQVDWTDVLFDAGGLSGRMGGRQEFAATGSSPAALVATLAGAGRLAIRGAAMAQTDPAGPGRTAALVAARDAAAERDAAGTDTTPTDPEAIRRDLAPQLDAAPLSLGDASVPATLAAGVLRAGPLSVSGTAPAPAAGPALAWSAEAVASLDLGGLTLRTRAYLRQGGTEGAGEVLVTRSGPIGGEARRVVDATGLVGLVQAQAIARAQDRIDVVEQDIRERAAFNRQFKAAQQRTEAEKQARADAARAAAEAQRATVARAAAEARQKAEDARVQSQLPPVEPPSD